MKSWWGWATGILILLIVLVWWQWPSNRVELIMCDVGQGDGLVLIEGYSQMVIDVGPDNGKMNTCLSEVMPFWDRHLEAVVITHTDKDHVGGLEDVLSGYRVDKIITTQESAPIIKDMLMNRSNVSVSWQGQQWQFGSISGEVMWPPKIEVEPNSLEVKKDTNRGSLVVRMTVANSQESLWLAGDADVFVEEHLINDKLVKPTTILKAGHHGSKTASSKPFLTILQPRQVWVSVSKNNQYGHPAVEVLELFNNVGVQVLRTDLLGTIKNSFSLLCDII